MDAPDSIPTPAEATDAVEATAQPPKEATAVEEARAAATTSPGDNAAAPKNNEQAATPPTKTASVKSSNKGKEQNKRTFQEKLTIIKRWNKLERGDTKEKEALAREFHFTNAGHLRSNVNRWIQELPTIERAVKDGLGHRRKKPVNNTKQPKGGAFHYNDHLPLSKNKDPNLFTGPVFKGSSVDTIAHLLKDSNKLSQVEQHCQRINGAIQFKHKVDQKPKSSLDKMIKELKRGQEHDIPDTATIINDINKELNIVPQMKGQGYEVDYMSLIISGGIQVVHMDLGNPYSQLDTSETPGANKWVHPVQGTIPLTSGNDGTIIYNTVDIPFAPTVHDLINMWKSNGHFAPDSLVEILTTNAEIELLVKQWGPLIYTGHHRRPTLKEVPKFTMTLFHGSIPHCGPAPNGYRVILFFTASRKMKVGKGRSKQATKRKVVTYDDEQMSLEKLLWGILVECNNSFTDNHDIVSRTECMEFMHARFAETIASTACYGTYDKTLDELDADFNKNKNATLRNLIDKLRLKCKAYVDGPSTVTEWDVQRTIDAIAIHHDFKHREKKPKQSEMADIV